MARRISAAEIIEKTGLKTKKEALYYARRFRVRFNSRNPEAFAKLIKLKVAEADDRQNMRKIKKTIVDPFIMNKNNTEEAEMVIGQRNLRQNIKYTIDGVTKRRFRKTSLTPMDMYDIMRNLHAKEGSVLTAFIKFNNYEYDEDMNLIRTQRDATFVVNDLLLENLRKSATRVANGDGGEGEHFYNAFNVYDDVQSIVVTQRPKILGFRNLEGGFFKYFIVGTRAEPFLVEMMERYQIYDYEHLISSDHNSDDNCLVHSLKLAGVDDGKIEKLKIACKSSKIALKSIRLFAETNELNIKIRVAAEVNEEGKKGTESYTFGKKGDPVVTLGLIKEHYFLNEEVNFNPFAMKNYEEIREQGNWHLICKRRDGGYRRDNKSKMSSFNLIKAMFDGGFFTPIVLNRDTIMLQDYNKIDVNKIELDNSKDVYEEMKKKEEKLIKDELIAEVAKSRTFKGFLNNIIDNKRIDIKVAFDFETTTNTEVHKPYMVACEIYAGCISVVPISTFTGSNCASKFLWHITNSIYKYMDTLGVSRKKNLSKGEEFLRSKIINQCFNITLFAHNITYDMQFLMKCVSNYNPIFRASTKICGGSFSFNGLNIHFKDTWAIIDCRLDQFQDFFKLKDIKKEIMPYNLYTEENVVKDTCKIEDALKFINKKEDKEEFLKNIDEQKIRIGGDNFMHILYAKYYCEIDVKVMMRGYFIFREWVLKQLNIDIDDFLTISSISDQFFKLRDCYEGCYYINGVARYYIQNTVVGGRCMPSENKKYLINERLNDFDGVSLYPSAMKRLGEIGGYLKGKPKVIPANKLNMKFLNKQDGYFVRIKVNKIRIKRDFPLASIVNKDGIRIFTNDLSSNNVLYVNKISLEDLIEFHDLRSTDFELLDGYYFDEGRNVNVLENIQEVFNLRAEYKAAKNPIQGLYKLIMNSAYGKTIMKEQDTQINYVDNKEDRDKAISKDYNDIKIIEQLYDCEKYIIKKRKPISDHSNACHIGSEILAMSKRIMNEVMCLAEDNGIKIYYQDTDSMHVQDSKIEELNELFIKKYGRELIGAEMGQFHNDFESIWRGGEEVKATSSVKTIILGKKAYIDMVEYKNGEIKPHFRMKGIPQGVVEEKAKKFANGIFELYTYLYHDNVVNFDLLCTSRPFFKLGYGSIANLRKFERNVKFNVAIKFVDKNALVVPEDEDYEAHLKEAFILLEL